MKNRTLKFRTMTPVVLLSFIAAATPLSHPAQTAQEDVTFSRVKVLQSNGEVYNPERETYLWADHLYIKVRKGTDITMKYGDIVSAEYSYSKKPRWKTGLTLGAVGVLFPPLWIVALPLGFSKHRKHWLTVRTRDDFAVIKIRKGNRKVVIPTFETRTGVTVEPVGEDK